MAKDGLDLGLLCLLLLVGWTEAMVGVLENFLTADEVVLLYHSRKVFYGVVCVGCFDCPYVYPSVTRISRKKDDMVRYHRGIEIYCRFVLKTLLTMGNGGGGPAGTLCGMIERN